MFVGTGTLSLAVASGLIAGVLTGKCEITLLPPWPRTQDLRPEGIWPMAARVCAHPLPCEPPQLEPNDAKGLRP